MRAVEYVAGFRRLTTVWLSAVTVMVLTLVALQSYLERKQLLETIITSGSVVSANAAAAVVFNDPVAATEMLSAFRASDIMIEAAFYRDDGSRLALFRPPRRAVGRPLADVAPALGEEFSLREVRVALPVTLNDRPVGTLALRATLDVLYAELARFAGGLAAISAFAVAFASLATHRLRERLAEKEVARRRAETELADSRDQLRQMMVHREHLLEEEHKRIAVEIHDQLGQLLTAAMLNLRSLERSLGTLDEDAKRQFEEVLGQLDESYYGMKNIATLLYPAVLKFGFRPAVEWLAGRLLKVAGIHWRIEVEEPFPALDPEHAMGLFRIVQEALVNVVHHSHAGDVRIALRRTETTVTLEIADDGQGFDMSAGNKIAGFGLIGMRERAESLGGHVTIMSRPGNGTTVQVTVPLVAQDAPAVG
ncbi:MAG: ATP-binding protein [Ignavibacteria bacterium]